MKKFTFFQIFCILTMVVTGIFGGTVTKWCSLQFSVGYNGEYHRFTHPFFWPHFMFMSEFACGWIYYGLFSYLKWKGEGKEETNIITRGSRVFNPLLVIPACSFDLVGVTLGMIGLHLTYLTSVVIFKGSVLIFASILSYIFLDRRFRISELFGMFLVIIGLASIGTCDFFFTDTSQVIPAFYVMIGDLIITMAQFFNASRGVYQQKVYFVNAKMPVLQLVGFEGFFGLIMMSIINTGLYFWHIGPKYSQNPREVVEDLLDAFIQISNHKGIMCFLMMKFVSLIFYKYTGLSIVKELSTVTKMVLDHLRTVVLWTISLSILGQPFIWPQIVAYGVLVYGICLYNEVSLFGFGRKEYLN